MLSSSITWKLGSLFKFGSFTGFSTKYGPDYQNRAWFSWVGVVSLEVGVGQQMVPLVKVNKDVDY